MKASSLKDEIAIESRVAELKSANQRLLLQLSQAKAKTADLVAAVYQASRDAAMTLDIPPVKAPKPDKRTHTAETAIALVSDLQLGKRTPTYNTKVCEERMVRYAEKIISLIEIQRSHHPVRRLMVPVLGDIIEGAADIFPGQQHLVDSSLYRQLTVDGPRIMVTFLRTLLTAVDSIEVEWIIGNHGRLGRKGEHDPETNGDRMLGKIVETILSLIEEPRVTFHEPKIALLPSDDEPEARVRFNVPDGAHERNWYSIARVGKYSALCIHGDQIKGHSGFPWYGLGKKVNGWAAGAIPEAFTDVFMGHWHQIASIPLNKRTVYVNGSTESYNTYAQENLAAMSDPAQWLLFAHPERGIITAEYKVWLS